MTNSYSPGSSTHKVALGLVDGSVRGVNSIEATQILSRHAGIRLLEAKHAVEAAMDAGRTMLYVDKVDRPAQLDADLFETGFYIDYLSSDFNCGAK